MINFVVRSILFLNKLSIVYLNCPVCNNNKFNTFVDIFDDRYGEPNKYKLAKCKKCNHYSTFPRLKEKDLGKLYENYYPRSDINYQEVLKKTKKFFNFFSYFIDWFNGTNNQGHLYAKKGEKVLDIGCGDCSSLLEIKSLGAKAFGIEADINVKSIAESLNLEVHFGSIEDKPFSGKKFDLIVMNQVIEHIPEPDKCLKLIKKRLTAQGRIIFVFPNKDSFWRKISGIKWINWHIPYHLHHFDKKSFQTMAQKCGLKITAFQTITPNIWTILQLKHFFSNPKRGEPNYIWEIKKNRNEIYKKRNSKPRFGKQILRITIFICLGLLNRLIDFLRAGDSLFLEVKIKDKR